MLCMTIKNMLYITYYSLYNFIPYTSFPIVKMAPLLVLSHPEPMRAARCSKTAQHNPRFEKAAVHCAILLVSCLSCHSVAGPRKISSQLVTFPSSCNHEAAPHPFLRCSMWRPHSRANSKKWHGPNSGFLAGGPSSMRILMALLSSQIAMWQFERAAIECIKTRHRIQCIVFGVSVIVPKQKLTHAYPNGCLALWPVSLFWQQPSGIDIPQPSGCYAPKAGTFKDTVQPLFKKQLQKGRVFAPYLEEFLHCSDIV